MDNDNYSNDKSSNITHTQYNKNISYKSLDALCGGGTAIDNVNNIVRWMDSLNGSDSTDIDNINKYIDILQSILEPSSTNSSKSATDIDILLDNLKTKLEKNMKKNADADGKSTMNLSINTFDQNSVHIPIDFNTIIQMYSDFVQKDKMFKFSINENKENISMIPQLSKTIEQKTVELKNKSEEFKSTISMLQNNLIKLKQNEFPIYLKNRIIWKDSNADIGINGTGFIPGDELTVKLQIVTNSLTNAQDELRNQNNLRENIDKKKEEFTKVEKSLDGVLPHKDLLQLEPVANNIKGRLSTIKNNLPPDICQMRFVPSAPPLSFVIHPGR